LLGTIDISDYWRVLPLRGHLNIGIPLGRNDISGNFPVTQAVAFELPSKFFSYFIELSRNHERDWHWRFSPGLKFHPYYRFSLTVAGDLGLVQDYRLLGASVGLSINSSLTRVREILPTGNIAGKILDRNTDEPVEAQVKIIDLDEAISSDRTYGVYKITGLPQGVYTLSVNAPNYAPQTKVVAVETNKTNLLDFALDRSLAAYGGVVLNTQTKAPITNASIDIIGKTETRIYTDSEGTFSELLIPGEYEVKVNKQNYAQSITHTFIAEDRYDTVMLKPIEIVAETPEAIVYFDLDDANVRTDQKETLDRIAEFLKDHPKIGCELRGHTDPSGNIEYNQILSLARANSVKDYFVKVHGVEKERIATLAFSKTKLVKESPEMSRRVEIFLIR
jgi:outer membrane protein OmpA-like peptidoglycan-associated protein